MNKLRIVQVRYGDGEYYVLESKKHWYSRWVPDTSIYMTYGSAVDVYLAIEKALKTPKEKRTVMHPTYY